MRWYEKNTGNKIRHIWHNEPRKPDVSCYLDGERLDLEIAHLYGSSEEAMQILNRELTEETQAELEKQSLLSDTQERLLAALNRILANKSLKYYKTSQVWLVIRNANPGWSKEEIIALQDRINIPDDHPFQQIWIVCDMAGSTGIVQLYPEE
ncbi:MAG: hypothetical protein ACFHVJ_07330 [Aestuariibacter sp.]